MLLTLFPLLHPITRLAPWYTVLHHLHSTTDWLTPSLSSIILPLAIMLARL